MIKELLQLVSLVCFSAIIITEIICKFDEEFIGSAVFGLFMLILIQMVITSVR
ncbi:hypothetical protein [Limosilactobacillus reuteri]|uniref:hypothetical protein n=1 Tax=Limosilactobacillus reuteri TaxID=1598 RepID=UPI0015C5DBC7|nr:hypothetical protein [Limosilactobacillus reuteri]